MKENMEIKILYLYPDLLELYGDKGNIDILKYRIEKRNIKPIIDTYELGFTKPDFKSYDLIFAGGGADNEQEILSSDIIKYKDDLKLAYQNGSFFLLICGAYQLFGKYYMDLNKNIIPGLDIFPYYTKAIDDPKKRSIGNIIIENENLGKIIGFENHGGQTYDIDSPFGKVLFGKGNNLDENHEGYFNENVIATYLHGPILSKNPNVSDYIISYCLKHKYNLDNSALKNIMIDLNDEFENKARDMLFKRFLNSISKKE